MIVDSSGNGLCPRELRALQLRCTSSSFMKPQDSTIPDASGDYLDWMKRAFNERCRNNPHYSMRAFARDLKLSPASMSYIMNGKNGMSATTAKRVADALGLNDQEKEIFCTLAQLRGRSQVSRSLAQKKLIQLQYQRESVLPADHHSSSVVVHIPSVELERAKEKILSFHREFEAEFSSKQPESHDFKCTLAIQFFCSPRLNPAEHQTKPQP